jgi:hypothetical protein
MSLNETVSQLLDWACGATGQPPRPTSVMVAEITPAARKGLKLQFSASDLRSVSEYEDRFEHLVDSGYAWINVSYCGEIRGHGLVLIEYPSSPARGKGAPSMNFGGPPRCVADASWDAGAYVALTP